MSEFMSELKRHERINTNSYVETYGGRVLERWMNNTTAA